MFSADGEWLLVEGVTPCAPEKPLSVFHLCHLPTKEWRQLELPEEAGWSMEFASDGTFFVTASYDALAIVHTKTVKVRLTFKPDRFHAGLVTFSPDGSILAVFGQTETRTDPRSIRFYSTAEGKELPEWKRPAEETLAWIRSRRTPNTSSSDCKTTFGNEIRLPASAFATSPPEVLVVAARDLA